MTYALIAALLVLLAFAALAIWILHQTCRILAQQIIELRSSIEYRDEIIANRLADEEIDVDVDCRCPRCLREAYSVN